MITPDHAASGAAPAVTDAMVDAYLMAQRRTVEEADRFGRPNVGGLHTNTVREACRAGLEAAALASPQVAPKAPAECHSCLGSGDANYLAPEWPEQAIRCDKCAGTGRVTPLQAAPAPDLSGFRSEAANVCQLVRDGDTAGANAAIRAMERFVAAAPVQVAPAGLINAAGTALDAYEDRFESTLGACNYIGPIDEEMIALRRALAAPTQPGAAADDAREAAEEAIQDAYLAGIERGKQFAWVEFELDMPEAASWHAAMRGSPPNAPPPVSTTGAGGESK